MTTDTKTADVIQFNRNPRTEKPQPAPRTRQEIEDLKDQWAHDSWDHHLEDTPGFEAHRDELHLFRLEQAALAEQQIAATYERNIQGLALEAGCVDNFSLAQVLYHMRERIGMLETELARMEASR